MQYLFTMSAGEKSVLKRIEKHIQKNISSLKYQVEVKSLSFAIYVDVTLTSLIAK